MQVYFKVMLKTHFLEMGAVNDNCLQSVEFSRVSSVLGFQFSNTVKPHSALLSSHMHYFKGLFWLAYKEYSITPIGCDVTK